MAAKQRGKKKSRDVRRKKSQKKLQRVKRKQKRSLPQKQKKSQSRLKRQAKRAKPRPSRQENKICRPHLFAARILREIPKVRMESKARMLMKTILTDMYNHVATQVEATLSQKNEPVDITASEVQAALKEAMTKEMAKYVAEPPPEAAPSECA